MAALNAPLPPFTTAKCANSSAYHVPPLPVARSSVMGVPSLSPLGVTLPTKARLLSGIPVMVETNSRMPVGLGEPRLPVPRYVDVG